MSGNNWDLARTSRFMAMAAENRSAQEIAAALRVSVWSVTMKGHIEGIELAGEGGWTKERIADLTRMWNDGLSCSVIAEKLGVTRNMVISKANRLSLRPRDKFFNKGGPKPLRAPDVKRPLSKNSETQFLNNAVKRIAKHKADVKVSQGAATFEAAPGEPTPIRSQAWQPLGAAAPALFTDAKGCRWPIEVASSDRHWCCDRKKKAGKPYCSAHAKAAFRPSTPPRIRPHTARADIVARRVA